jgi:hypothetical protein
MPAGFATGKDFMRGLPHEGKGLLQALRGLSRGEALRELPREAKPFTRAKWESRFQRFAISFRPSALDVCSTSRVAQLYAAMSKGLLRGVTRQQ